MPPSSLSPTAVLQAGPPMPLPPPPTTSSHQETNNNTTSTTLSVCSSAEASRLDHRPVAKCSACGGNCGSRRSCTDGNYADDGGGLIEPVVGRIPTFEQQRQHQLQQQQQQEEEQEQDEEDEEATKSRSSTHYVFQQAPMASSNRRKSSSSSSSNSSTPQSQSLSRSQPQSHSSLLLSSCWEEIEDDLFVMLDGHIERFQLLQSFFFDPVWQQQPDLMSGSSPSSLSLMALATSVMSKSPRTTKSNNNTDDTTIVHSNSRRITTSVASGITNSSSLRADRNSSMMVSIMEQLSNISQSMAFLVSQRQQQQQQQHQQLLRTGDDQNNTDDGETDTMNLHDEHISFLASFFASTTPTTPSSRAQKVAVVDCFVKLCLVAHDNDDKNDNDNEIKTMGKNINSDTVIGGGGDCCDREDYVNKHANVATSERVVLPSIENETEAAQKLLRFLTVRRADWPIPTGRSSDGAGDVEGRSSSMRTTTNTTSCTTTTSKNIEEGYLTLMTLMFEIRAQCLRLQEEENERKLLRIRRMTESSDDAALVIAASAKLVELGIHHSSKLVERKIESAGEAAKQWVEVDDEPLILDRDAVVAMAFSDTAKRASEYAREGTAMAVDSILDVSISGLHKVGEHLTTSALTGGDSGDDEASTTMTGCDHERHHDNESAGHGLCGGPLSPCERREMLKAAGKVSMAAFGAAALVGEAMVHTGRSAASKTAGVAADIVGHKYGSTAGDVVKNAGDTAGNLVSVAANVALVDSTVLAKHVAKNASRVHVDGEAQRARERIEAFEKRVTSMMSTNLGIQVSGDWVGQIESLSKNQQHDDLKEKE